MTNEIKTWQARMQEVYGRDTRGFKPDEYMCAEIAELRAKVESLAADAGRYKEVRTWSPRKFTDVWELNIAGKGAFDDLVDSMAKEKT